MESGKSSLLQQRHGSYKEIEVVSCSTGDFIINFLFNSIDTAFNYVANYINQGQVWENNSPKKPPIYYAVWAKEKEMVNQTKLLIVVQFTIIDTVSLNPRARKEVG